MSRSDFFGAIFGSIVIGGHLLVAPLVYGQEPRPHVNATAVQAPDSDEHAKHHADDEATVERVAEPYPLQVCPISGGRLGSMGEPIIKSYDGREVRFCCAGCPPKFESDLAASMKKLDSMIIADQAPYYPLDTCVVSGEPLRMDGEDIGIDVVFGNRLVRLCCKGCVADLKAEPEKYLPKLDAAIVKAQRDRYPLDTCVVSGEDMGGLSDEEIVEVVVANRLFRLCCPPCKPDLISNPAPYLKKLDEAWTQSPGGMPGVNDMSTRSEEHGKHQHGEAAPKEHMHGGGAGHGRL